LRDAAKLVCLAWFVFATNHEVSARAHELWERGHWLGLAAFGAIWSAALVALAAVAWNGSRKLRVLWSAPIALSALLGDLAYAITGHHLAFYDVVLYASERAHWGNALTLYSSWLAPILRDTAIGLLGFWLAPQRRSPRALAAASAPAIPLALIAALIGAEAGKGTRALPEQFAPLAMLMVAAIVQPLDPGEAREAAPLPPEVPPLVRHVFLIVDESVRADFLDLNGAQGVTPFLASRSGDWGNFGYAVAGNNCSLFANLILRYGGTRDSLARTLRSGASIWSFAHAAGFRTVYVDAQLSGDRLQNGMTPGERREIDRVVQLGDAPILERDERVAAELVALAREDQPSFALVDKWGSHFPYAHNYPPEAEHFAPALRGDEPIGSDRVRLLNAYRNSVRWTTDRFLERLLQADLSQAVVLYTSDHGQNLLDRGVVTHCNSSDPHPLEGVVPLLVLAGPPDLRARFARAAQAKLDRASHFELFPTALELMGYPPQRRTRYGPSLLDPEPTPGPRAFSYGPVIGLSREIHWREVPPDARALALESSTSMGGAR
jgi:lipid A ethanolaminephosphotransferase